MLQIWGIFLILNSDLLFRVSDLATLLTIYCCLGLLTSCLAWTKCLLIIGNHILIWAFLYHTNIGSYLIMDNRLPSLKIPAPGGPVIPACGWIRLLVDLGDIRQLWGQWLFVEFSFLVIGKGHWILALICIRQLEHHGLVLMLLLVLFLRAVSSDVWFGVVTARLLPLSTLIIRLLFIGRIITKPPFN